MRILLVKLGPIGDAVMATPIIEAAARLYPGCTVTWLCTESLRPLLWRLRPQPELITVPDQVLWHGSLPARLGMIAKLWQRLGGRSFDLGLFAHANPRLQVLIPPGIVAQWRRFQGPSRRPHPVPGRRHHHEHVRLLTGTDDERATVAVFPQLSLQLPPEEVPPRAVALCPGGAKNPLREDLLRRWPVESFATLARLVLEAGATPVLVGGPGDTWVRRAFAGLPVIDLIGRRSLGETLDTFAMCRVAVAHDSGPMHLADLAGVPVAAIFGPTMPAEKGPLRSHSRVFWGGAELACRPCYDGIRYAPCTSALCMQETLPQDVALFVRNVLDHPTTRIVK